MLAASRERLAAGDVVGAMNDIAVCLQFALDASRVPMTDPEGFHWGGLGFYEPCGHGWGGCANASENYRAASVLLASIELIAWAVRELDRMGGPRAADLRAAAQRQYPSLRDVVERGWVLARVQFVRGDLGDLSDPELVRRFGEHSMAQLDALDSGRPCPHSENDWLTLTDAAALDRAWREGRALLGGEGLPESVPSSR